MTAAAALAVAGALAAALADPPLKTSSLQTTPSASLGQTAIAQGLGPAVLKNATAQGATPPSTFELVSFILRGRNMFELASDVESGRSPDLTVAKFASQYGQSTTAITALENYLRQYGIATVAYPDNLDVTASGTAAQFDRALSVQQDQYQVPAVAARDGQAAIPAQQIHGTSDDPYLPASIAPDVLAILGLTNYAPFRDDAARTPQGAKSTGTVTATAAHTGNLTPADFAQTYDLGPLQHRGITGQGQTLGIVTLAGFDPATAEYFWDNVLHLTTKPNRITSYNVDNGPGAPSEAAGSGESDLDVEQAGAVAPDANIVVYPAPDTEGGYADAFFAAASQNLADTVSSSWGESETLLLASAATGGAAPAYAQAFDEAFLELAAQGQSTFIAAGNAGAYDAAADLGTTNLSVGQPGGQPVRHQRGRHDARRHDHRGDHRRGGEGDDPRAAHLGLGLAVARLRRVRLPGRGDVRGRGGAGGGGGFSSYEPLPLYQSMLDEQNSPGAGSYSAVPYLTPADYGNVDNLYLPTQWNFDPKPAVVSGQGTGRGLPDLVTDADPFTGYLLYDPLASPALQGGWGGTSFGAAQLNGAAALIDQSAGHRVGLWNPAIYSFALGSHSPFTPLSTSGPGNDSLYYTGTPGQVFNPGSGLGYPDLAKLAGDFG